MLVFILQHVLCKEPESCEDDPDTLRKKLSSYFEAESNTRCETHQLLVTPGRQMLATPPARGASTASLPTPEDAKLPAPNRRQRRAAPVPPAPAEPSQHPEDPLEVQLQAWKAKVAAQMDAIQTFRSAPQTPDPREEEIKRLQAQAAQQAALIQSLRSGTIDVPSPAKVYKPTEEPASNPSPGKSSKPSPAPASNPSPDKSSKPVPAPAPASKPSESAKASSPGPSNAVTQDDLADVIITPDGATAAWLYPNAQNNPANPR